jgi:hypothetical protein
VIRESVGPYTYVDRAEAEKGGGLHMFNDVNEGGQWWALVIGARKVCRGQSAKSADDTSGSLRTFFVFLQAFSVSSDKALGVDGLYLGQ